MTGVGAADQELDRARAAIVTGASSGIGRACALRLAHVGYDIGVTFHTNRAGAEQVAAEARALGRTAAVVSIDMAHTALVPAAITELVERLDGVDVLVNNAGVNRRARVVEETEAGWRRTLAVNLIGPWACAHAAASHMIGAGRGGRIINVTSVLALAPIDGGGAYCASKAGLDMLTKVMALELAEHGITVNAVAPGHTATPMNFTERELAVEETIARPVIPAARAASPDEIADAVVHLAGPNASYTIGASLLVDGGLLLVSGPESLQRSTGMPPQRTTDTR
jgi:NAD(P)-dependent dehydrogenase (short-subunit alcohol dehydrogenase family)